MKKYKLLKDLPWIKTGSIITWSRVWEKYYDVWEFVFREEMLERNKDFFEAIEEKKTFDNIKEGDEVWYINTNWSIDEPATYRKIHCRSEVFITREEAEDEHKRREWACRKDKFIPKEGELFYFSSQDGVVLDHRYKDTSLDVLRANSWLCFRTKEECQDAIDNHDIVRLFYTIR